MSSPSPTRRSASQATAQVALALVVLFVLVTMAEMTSEDGDGAVRRDDAEHSLALDWDRVVTQGDHALKPAETGTVVTVVIALLVSLAVAARRIGPARRRHADDDGRSLLAASRSASRAPPLLSV